MPVVYGIKIDQRWLTDHESIPSFKKFAGSIHKNLKTEVTF